MKSNFGNDIESNFEALVPLGYSDLERFFVQNIHNLQTYNLILISFVF